MLKVYFDSSVLFSAIYSSTGGSRRLFKLANSAKFVAIMSETVIDEVIANTEKIPRISLFDIVSFVEQNSIVVLEKIVLEDIKLFLDIVNVKDAHVVAGATMCGCDYLVTLDKKHLDNSVVKKSLRDKGYDIEIVSPADLLQDVFSLE